MTVPINTVRLSFIKKTIQRMFGTTANEGTRVFTPDVVYLRWVNIDMKVLGTLLFIVVASLDEMKGIW